MTRVKITPPGGKDSDTDDTKPTPSCIGAYEQTSTNCTPTSAGEDDPINTSTTPSETPTATPVDKCSSCSEKAASPDIDEIATPVQALPWFTGAVLATLVLNMIYQSGCDFEKEHADCSVVAWGLGVFAEVVVGCAILIILITMFIHLEPVLRDGALVGATTATVSTLLALMLFAKPSEWSSHLVSCALILEMGLWNGIGIASIRDHARHRRNDVQSSTEEQRDRTPSCAAVARNDGYSPLA